MRRPRWRARVLLESALIVFSVLLALGLNEWRASAAQRTRVTLALSAIRSEIEQNQRLVQSALEYHMRVAESFAASARAGEEQPDFAAMDEGLLSPARLVDTAWESARSAGLTADMPYATVLRLSQTYGLQRDYAVLSHAIGHIAYELVMREGFDATIRRYANYVIVQQDFAGRERHLLQHYAATLEQLR